MSTTANSRKASTVGERAIQLMQRKRPLTYRQIAEKIREEFPEACTTTDSVAWYASRMRKRGQTPNVRPAVDPSQRKGA